MNQVASAVPGLHAAPAAGAAYDFHYAAGDYVAAGPEALFSHLDDPRRLAAHMGKSSWMMLGSKMEIDLDRDEGRAIGALIGLRGRVLGIPLAAEEAVTERRIPFRKAWEIIGTPHLLVVGRYRMGFNIAAEGDGSRLTVFIDYDLPGLPLPRWLSRRLGAIYAHWCVRRMIADAVAAFGVR